MTLYSLHSISALLGYANASVVVWDITITRGPRPQASLAQIDLLQEERERERKKTHTQKVLFTTESFFWTALQAKAKQSIETTSLLSSRVSTKAAEQSNNEFRINLTQKPLSCSKIQRRTEERFENVCKQRETQHQARISRQTRT